MTEVLHAIMAPNEQEEPDEVLEWLREVRKRYMGKETRRLARLRAGVFKPEYMDKCRRALGEILIQVRREIEFGGGSKRA